MKDMLENELLNGDLVAYAQRWCNEGRMRIGIVVDAKKDLVWSYGYSKPGPAKSVRLLQIDDEFLTTRILTELYKRYTNYTGNKK